MKVGIITGSYPPDICGVSDYTERLADQLRLEGVTVHIYTGKDWRIRSALKNAGELSKLGLDILHMQYPATGYGWKLGPQLMAIANPMVLTLHEASQAHVLRRLSLYPFSLRAQQVIFTNEFERAFVQRYAPWIKDRSHVVPIGNNVPVSTIPVTRDSNKVTYVGLIRPEKGLEEVIELSRLLKMNSERRKIRILGQLMPGQDSYYEQLRTRAVPYDIEWQIGLSGEALSTALAASDIAYVPFPDGASERRGSLIALLANGAAVITTKGRHTPDLMRDAIVISDSPVDAYAHILNLGLDTGRRIEIRREALKYAAKSAWSNIAAQHISIYERAISHSKNILRKA